MKTVNEVSRLTGVSVRTLHYYDKICLLPPSMVTDAGYRLYDDKALARLQNILLFRELKFPLNEIKEIIDCPSFDQKMALEQQIKLLELQREHISDLISFARGIKLTGVNNMDFSAFDQSKIDEYTAQAKTMWGKTEAYKEFEEKSKNRSSNAQDEINEGLMQIFSDIGKIKEQSPDSEAAHKCVKCLQDYISKFYYTCTNEILLGLGQMYIGGGSMTENIDDAGGKGTADFCNKAIIAFCM